MPFTIVLNSFITTIVNDTVQNFVKKYKDDLMVIFDQWLKLHLCLDALSNQKILKGIYYRCSGLNSPFVRLFLGICSSDESETSWLEPYSSSWRIFGSARGLFPSARKNKFQLENWKIVLFSLFSLVSLDFQKTSLFSVLIVVNNSFLFLKWLIFWFRNW